MCCRKTNLLIQMEKAGLHTEAGRLSSVLQAADQPRWRVHLHTKPSPGHAYYEGHLDVWAENEEQAKQRALRELTRPGGNFSEYGVSSFKVDKIERLK